ncbi:MAG: hypothetical protein LBU38_08165, partial [Propionibacteriaceae bacterium]|nr:hypothetical protein [Propionibacteriaceae bacterium]
DGTTNATLKRGDEMDEITLERAAELLADKRANPPAPRTRKAKAVPKKRATAKKK